MICLVSSCLFVYFEGSDHPFYGCMSMSLKLLGMLPSKASVGTCLGQQSGQIHGSKTVQPNKMMAMSFLLFHLNLEAWETK